jgi:hypothetical protein
MSAAESQDGVAGALSARAAASGRMWELDIIGRIWRTFTSVRLALVLILLIAAAVLAGTLIDQVPASVFADPSAYAAWLERAEASTASSGPRCSISRSSSTFSTPSGSASW